MDNRVSLPYASRLRICLRSARTPVNMGLLAIITCLMLLSNFYQEYYLAITVWSDCTLSFDRRDTKAPYRGHLWINDMVEGSNPCTLDEYSVWEEWKDCLTKLLIDSRWKSLYDKETLSYETSVALPAETTIFEDFILQHRDLLPWALPSNITIVLLEFRVLERQLIFTITNAVNNLPARWPLQVVGGPSICEAVQRLFPVEVAAGKVYLTDLGEDAKHNRETINQVYTDISFYRKLRGTTWLFIQVDSVICKAQRHLLKGFILKDRGWWGAPWSVWQRDPKIGGNGGFSLRKKAFIETILERFSWDGVTPEDWWFCNKAADIYNDLPETLKPATMEDEIHFSSESIFSERPFGVHKYWISLPPGAPEMIKLLENCPENLGMFPSEYLAYPSWRGMVCALNVTRKAFDQRTNITFDFETSCSPEA